MSITPASVGAWVCKVTPTLGIGVIIVKYIVFGVYLLYFS